MFLKHPLPHPSIISFKYIHFLLRELDQEYAPSESKNLNIQEFRCALTKLVTFYCPIVFHHKTGMKDHEWIESFDELIGSPGPWYSQ